MHLTKYLSTFLSLALLASPALSRGASSTTQLTDRSIAAGNPAGALLAVQNNKAASIRTSACGPKDPQQQSGKALSTRENKRVQVGAIETGGSADSLYTFNLKTCIGITGVSGDKKKRAMAHISAVTSGRSYHSQMATFVSTVRNYDDIEITISLPDSAEGGSNLQTILKQMIKDIVREAKRLDTQAATHPRPLHFAGGGDMDIDRSGSVYADGKCYA